MMKRDVFFEIFPNVNIRDSSHDKNLPLMSVTGSINHVFKMLSGHLKILRTSQQALLYLIVVSNEKIEDS